VKLVRTTKSGMVFDLVRREEQLLLRVFKCYPCVPPAHQVLTKSSPTPNAEANQQLLDEALAEQRADIKQQLQALMADPRRFTHTETGARLSLSPPALEWLLQVLNDVRVGSWIKLGSPDKKPAELTAANAPHYLTMETAGYFQMQLLGAMEGGVERET
jgi:hypothetical protein